MAGRPAGRPSAPRLLDLGPFARRRGPAFDAAELADHLAGGFRAGLPPARVWLLLAARPGPFAALAGAVAVRSELGLAGGRALWESAGPPRREDLVTVAAVLDLCERSGAPAADVLDALAGGLRAESAAATEVRIALEAPAATARVMSLLPLAGLALGALLGIDTLHVLVSTSAGHACLVAGAAAWASGRWWISRLVTTAQHPPDDDP